MAVVLPISIQLVPSKHLNVTANRLPDTVPVDNVPVDTKPSTHVITYDVVPLVVIAKVVI